MIAKWNERYRRGEACGPQEPDELVVYAAGLLTPGHAMDVACGAGRHAVYLAGRGWRVTAMDGAEAALALFEAPGVTKLCVDLEQQELPSLAADLVVVTMYLDRRLFAALRAEARAVAMVLPAEDEDPAVAPMNPAYLIGKGELEREFAGWRILRAGERKSPGVRRRAELLAVRP